jgi:hypothetical protein
MIKRVLTLVSAMHMTVSVFSKDDESGLHHDYEVWLERLAPHAPIDQAGLRAGCTTGRARTPVPDVGTGCRRAPEAGSIKRLHVADHGPGGGGGGD